MRTLRLRAVKTLSHEEIQPFKLSRNIFFQCTVSNYIYQGAVFKATKSKNKNKIKKFNAHLTSPSWWGGNDVIVCVLGVHMNPNTKPHKSGYI